jgi:spore coat polysaccharide biosynthesis protein SpsF
MTSERFPGKVLAPFAGLPLIAQLLARVQAILPTSQITLATSSHHSDDPLACYMRQLGVQVYRGSLTDVFGRFRGCLRENPCDWFFRLCGDSPLLDVGILQRMLPYVVRSDLDVVTNVQKRTFPKGHSVEMIRSEPFAAIDGSRLTDEEKEHLTQFYYNHPNEFHILNVESGDTELARRSFVVDTLDDYRRLQQLVLDGQL